MTDDKLNIQEPDMLLSEQDEQMLEMFFSDQRTEIQDHGFSRRVMRQLPSRGNKLSRWWTVLCTIVGVAFFIFIRGWEQLANALTVAVRTVPAQDVFHLTPITILVAMFVLVFMALARQVETEIG
ncbi:MAG: DUF5056 domain-containing protein [Prevotella sp.]|nr:DUF5056 domain-containing protein [Prevotella sp.]